MTIKSKSKTCLIEIDLTGPEGNAFSLLGVAKRLSKITGEDWLIVQTEMQSGDYENLIKVFDRYFGAFVTMYR